MIRAAMIAMTVASCDLITKIVLVTPTGLQHPVGVGRAIQSYVVIVGLAALVAMYRSAGAATALAGVVCNVIDGADGIVQNPLVVHHDMGATGFNVADIAIGVGAICCVGELTTRMYRWGSRRTI